MVKPENAVSDDKNSKDIKDIKDIKQTIKNIKDSRGAIINAVNMKLIMKTKNDSIDLAKPSQIVKICEFALKSIFSPANTIIESLIHCPKLRSFDLMLIP